jgi:hypothetical protein
VTEGALSILPDTLGSDSGVPLELLERILVSASLCVTAYFGSLRLGVHALCTHLVNLTIDQADSEAGSFQTNRASVIE